MRKSIIGLTAIAAIATPLAFATSANAAVTGPYTTGFDDGVTIDPTPGAGDRWRMTGNYDATITDGNDPALRISNEVTSGSFGDQLFSPTLAVPATETGPARTFTASFELEPVDYQEGLRVTVSPDNGQGGRGVSSQSSTRTAALNLVSQGSYVDKAGELQWAVTPVATGLDVTKPHTVTLKLVKKPGTNKSNNDVFSVQVDGKPVKNTTFEAYYQATGESNYQTDTLMFRLSGTPSELLGRPADRRRHHRDLLTQRNTAARRGGPTDAGGPSLSSRTRWLRRGPRQTRTGVGRGTLAEPSTFIPTSAATSTPLDLKQGLRCYPWGRRS